ncbi:MAG: class I SAM-dependent methyltransferase [Candidatus Hermodarchaeota archaeon]
MENLPKSLELSGALEIANRLKSISGGKVLDICTATGDFIRTLMKTLKDYDWFVGMDISKKDLETAKKQFENQPVEIIEMNAETLEFENGSFDTVCLSHSLHHLEKIDKVLTEIKRVLRPDGCFILQESYCDGEQTEAQKAEILQHHWISEIDSLQGIPHNNTLSKQKIKEIIANLGLKEIEIIDSTHYVKCLLCENKFKCEDPKNEDNINFGIKEVDDALDRLKEHPDWEKLKEEPKYRTLKQESEKIKQRIKEVGIAPASILFIIGKK